ncbi:MAG: pilus assembly protein PilB, partial [Terriglobia bacterium]
MAELSAQTEIERARDLAERYHFDFVDLRRCEVDRDLLRSVPLDLMVKYEFFPLEAQDHSLTVVIA